MSFILAAPEALVATASDVAGIGSTLSAANAAAAAPTTGVLAAAADEVSTQIAALFSQHAQGYQQLSARAAAFHEQFVQALTASASSYVAAETNAAQALVNAVHAPAAAAGSALSQAGGVVSSAVSRVENLFMGSFMGSALLLRPTGGLAAAGALLRASPLLHPGGLTNAMATSAAVTATSIATSIENLYNLVEPYVQYGFELVAYVAGFLPLVGILAPQINFLYDLFEPMVQAALFNTLDWLSGTITFMQGLSNFWAATTASINQFIQTEINWLLHFLPPLPPPLP